MKNKTELMQDGYTLLGKYSEELLSYFKSEVIDDIPGVSYYFVDNQGNVVGDKKFISKKEIGLAVNIHEKLAFRQRKLFKKTNNRPRKNKGK